MTRCSPVKEGIQFSVHRLAQRRAHAQSDPSSPRAHHFAGAADDCFSGSMLAVVSVVLRHPGENWSGFAQLLFWFAPFSCSFWVLLYSQWSRAMRWQHMGWLHEWRRDHGGLGVSFALAASRRRFNKAGGQPQKVYPVNQFLQREDASVLPVMGAIAATTRPPLPLSCWVPRKRISAAWANVCVSWAGAFRPVSQCRGDGDNTRDA
jgi:hypothetical protein